MLYGLRDKYNRFRFARACAGVMQTPPARLDSQSNVLLFTQLQHKDVLLALIAVKSFVGKVPIGSVRILNDGSLTSTDLAVLETHLPGVEFLNLETVRTAACPIGGTWERLLWISRLSRDCFVIQLDSDTLTIDELPEVKACIAEGRSFVIGTWDNQKFESMAFRRAEAARYLAAHVGNPHVQLLAEANFDKLEQYESLRYARGCSGFSGFAQGSVDTGFIERISQQMRAAIGDAWHRWGSEQVMSNIVVAHDRRAVVLPHPKYCDCTKVRAGATAFVHFIGSCRFVGDVYSNLARKVIS